MRYSYNMDVKVNEVNEVNDVSKKPKKQSKQKDTLHKKFEEIEGNEKNDNGTAEDAGKSQKKPWTKEEDELLKKERQSKMTIEEIAIAHNRSVGAIRARFGKYQKELFAEIDKTCAGVDKVCADLSEYSARRKIEKEEELKQYQLERDEMLKVRQIFVSTVPKDDDHKQKLENGIKSVDLKLNLLDVRHNLQKMIF